MNVRGLTAVVLACGTALLAAAPAADAEVKAGAVTKSAGTVTATLSWKAGEFAVTAPRLSITRGGVLVSDLDVADVCKGCLLIADDVDAVSGATYSIMHVADLDGDGEPEVMFDTFSGGAHCCTVQRIYAYRPATNSYRRTLSQYWGNAGYEIEDLDGDKIPEISGGEDAFAFAFSSYAASAFPPKILRYRLDQASGKARVTDVTRKFPMLIRKEAARLLKVIRGAKRDGTFEIQGFLAAYVAEQYLLGRGAVGKAELARAKRRGLTSPGFQTELLKFLKRTGYR